MRPLSLFSRLFAGVLLLAAPALARAGDLRYFEDAALRAVQFYDLDEGWAVGDDGVVWHSIDGGRNWERQSTGVRASLRSVHFIDPYTGWIAGREELPQGGSAGVILVTRDGGLNWKRVMGNSLPGLNLVRFVDEKTGFLAGDGSDQLPSGLYQTTDGGKNWQPVPGKRAPSWLAAHFGPGGAGVLAGAWMRMATLRGDHITLGDTDALGGRNLRGMCMIDAENGIAVGDGGLVLMTHDGGKKEWPQLDVGLSPEMRANWDFHAVHSVGSKIWVVGRPGSALLHSRNQGKDWQVLPTKQSLPLYGVFFKDEVHGWAVGELGQIVATGDGGKTWQIQHRASPRRRRRPDTFTPGIDAARYGGGARCHRRLHDGGPTCYRAGFHERSAGSGHRDDALQRGRAPGRRRQWRDALAVPVSDAHSRRRPRGTDGRLGSAPRRPRGRSTAATARPGHSYLAARCDRYRQFGP